MTAPTTADEALILGRTEQGESWWRLDLLTDHGVEVALLRRSRRSGTGGPPDWLDLVRVELERKEGGGARFVKGIQLVHRWEGLGRSYPALTEAGRWAEWLRRNGAHLPDSAAVRQLFDAALGAWATGMAPAAVGLKFGWRLARAEGWPVQEDWLVQLGPAQSRQARLVLRVPLAELEIPPPAIAALQDDLLAWLEAQVR